MEGLSKQERNKMALTFAILVALIYIVLSSAVNLMVGSFITFYALKVVAYLLYFVIIGFFAARIRKANGGFIEFRELFGSVFIMILVAGVLIYLYNYLYIKVIDPDFMNKIKASTVGYLESHHAPTDRLDETARKFDEQIEATNHLNIAANLQAFFGALIADSLLGLIVCLIVRKSRPVF